MKIKIPVVIALIICFINIFLHGLHGGFELALKQNSGIFSTSGSGYQLLANCYFFISGLLLIFTVGKLVKKEIVSQIVCLLALILVIFQFRLVYLQKSLFFENTDAVTKLMRETILFDWISLALVLVLLIIQIVTFFQQYIGKGQKIA